MSPGSIGRARRRAVWTANLAVAAGLLTGTVASTARAHGGATIDKDPCVQNLGARAIHFTVYQPQLNPAAEYCRDVPNAAASIVVFDLIDPELRKIPLDLRIERTSAAAQETLVHVPAKLYGTGIINADVTFDEPGRYAAVLTPEQGAPVVFPLRVEMGLSILFWMVPLLAAAPALYWWSQRRSTPPPADERPNLAIVR